MINLSLLQLRPARLLGCTLFKILEAGKDKLEAISEINLYLSFPMSFRGTPLYLQITKSPSGDQLPPHILCLTPPEEACSQTGQIWGRWILAEDKQEPQK